MAVLSHRYRRWCFTLNNPVEGDLDDIRKYLVNIKIYGFREECGAVGTPHYQGFLVLNNSITRSALSKNTSVRCHYEPMIGSLLDNWKYCCEITKEGYIAGPFFYPDRDTVYSYVMSNGQSEKKRKLSDVVIDIESGSDVSLDDRYILHMKNCDMSVKKRKFRQNTEYVISMYLGVCWQPWQNQCFEQLVLQNDRQVLWIYECVGNTGKTFLAKYLKNECNYSYLEGETAMHKIALMVAMSVGVVIDIPRSSFDEDKNSVICSYATMEKLKNGHLFTTKYEGLDVVTPSYKIVVFSNYPPDYTKLSLDRWRVAQIVHNKLIYD